MHMDAGTGKHVEQVLTQAVLACRQALRQRAAMWTTPGEQPPLFYFMRKDLTEYLTRVSSLSAGTARQSGMSESSFLPLLCVKDRTFICEHSGCP